VFFWVVWVDHHARQAAVPGAANRVQPADHHARYAGAVK
jgi:hypothetical protein